MTTNTRSRAVHCTPRTAVRKAEEIRAEAWLLAGLPKGHGLAPARVMAGQMADLAARVLGLLRAQQERYARYVEEHPPSLAPVHKDAGKDLPPEALGTYHTWLEGAALRREWSGDPATSFELDRAQLSVALEEALEEAVGTGAEGARRALGALRPGFASLGQAEARKLLGEITAYAAADSPESRAIYLAIADRAGGKAMRAAVLRDGAGRLLGAVSYRTQGGVLEVEHLGALDSEVPGTGVQLVRELAAAAAKEGKGVLVRAPLEAQPFFSGLGFAPDATGGLRLSAQAASALAEGTLASAPGWVRVGWLQGPELTIRTGLAGEFDTATLTSEVKRWRGIAAGTGEAGIKQATLMNANLMIVRDAEGKLVGVASYTLTGSEPLRVGYLATDPKTVGVGRRTMRELAAIAKEEGRGMNLLSTPQARGFYERLGMTSTGKVYGFSPAEAAAFASGLTGTTAFGGQLTWELAVAGASDWLRNHKIRGVVDEVSATTHQALVDELARGLERGESTQELAQRVRNLDRAFGPARAERIARTEVITANRAGGYQIGIDAGCTEHEWRSRIESPRTRQWHRAAHRQRVPYGQPYTVYNRKGEPQQLLYPGDGSLGAGPDNLINCRCSERRIKPGVTADLALGIDEHGLATAPAAPGPVITGL